MTANGKVRTFAAGKAEGYELSRCSQDREAKLEDMSYPGVARIGRQS